MIYESSFGATYLCGHGIARALWNNINKVDLICEECGADIQTITEMIRDGNGDFVESLEYQPNDNSPAGFTTVRHPSTRES